MQRNISQSLPLPGVTRQLPAKKLQRSGEVAANRQRKTTAVVLGAVAAAFLFAGAVFNPAFLVIGGFLAFGAVVVSRPPIAGSHDGAEIAPVDSTRNAMHMREMLPGTAEYEIRHGSMKWE
jgi:hypothetical protein